MIKTIRDTLTLGDIKSWVLSQEYQEMEEKTKFYYCPDCMTRLWSRGGGYVCPMCGQIYESVRRVHFDCHGVTSKCPRYYNVISAVCRECMCYRGSEGFDVFCAYPKEDK